MISRFQSSSRSSCVVISALGMPDEAKFTRARHIYLQKLSTIGDEIDNRDNVTHSPASGPFLPKPLVFSSERQKFCSRMRSNGLIPNERTIRLTVRLVSIIKIEDSRSILVRASGYWMDAAAAQERSLSQRSIQTLPLCSMSNRKRPEFRHVSPTTPEMFPSEVASAAIQ